MYRIDYTVRRHGVFLGKTSERMVVRKKGEELQELPLRRLRSILIDARGVSLSGALVQTCADFGVEIYFLDFRSRAVSRLGAPHQHETAATMRGQFAATENGKGSELGRQMVREKLKARGRLINYHKRRAPKGEKAIDTFLEGAANAIDAVDELQGRPMAKVRDQLMGIEGAASRRFWTAMEITIPDEAQFQGREHRGAEDLVNRMLNYGYAILESRVWSAIERAGLHPFEGVLHAERAGKPSMVLDMMEPWRIVVDDAVFSILRRSRSRLPAGFDGRFKKDVIREVTNRLDSPRDYGDKRLPTRECMVEACRNVGVYFRGEGRFRPFRWDVRGPKKGKEG